MKIDDVNVSIIGADDMSETEVREYIREIESRNPGKVKSLTITLKGEDVTLDYRLHLPFERIRRITGYLVGTIDRWNDGKKAELVDRLKHA